MKEKKIPFFKILLSLSFVLLTACILTHSRLSLYYAFTGLELWYTKMIPALLPFMILSGILVRLELTEEFTTLVYPLVRPLFGVSRNVCYVMILGFLCGFPMGAKCVNDLHSRGRITAREAEYLLAFCNHIGPVYFCSFALPLLGIKNALPYIFGMYGIPFLYGLLLRYTCFRDIGRERIRPDPHRIGSPVLSAGARPIRFSEQLDDAIHSSLQSIAMLGGYMILFNLLNLPLHLLLGEVPCYFAPLLEITGGLMMLGKKMPLYSLLALSFGGLSCIAQTAHCIRGTGLSVPRYVLHKLALTALTALYYAGWYLMSCPSGVFCVGGN